MFYGCFNTNVVLGRGLTNIEDTTFYYCAMLTHLDLPDGILGIGASAFERCANLIDLTIPGSVTSLGDYAFANCQSLTGIYFMGNAPAADSTVFLGSSPTVYYLPGTAGWDSFSAATGRPVALWTLANPVILSASASVQSSLFGFTISWATNLPVVVEASMSFSAASSWQPLQTNSVVNGVSYFGDAEWTNYPSRFYRVRSLASP
jgi:hypothetical protein